MAVVELGPWEQYGSIRARAEGMLRQRERKGRGSAGAARVQELWER